MDDLTLREALRPLARELLPADRERRDAAIRSSFDATGALLPGALGHALPPLVFTWHLPGALSVGSNVSAEIELPGDVRLYRLIARVKSAPSGVCQLRLMAGDDEVETVSIASGASRGVSPIGGVAARQYAGTVLRLDVVAAASAANATVLAAYTIAD